MYHPRGKNTPSPVGSFLVPSLGVCPYCAFISSRRRHPRCLSAGVQTCALPISSRRRHTRCLSDWSSDVCSSDLRTLSRLWVRIRRAKGSGLTTEAAVQVNVPSGHLVPPVPLFPPLRKENPLFVRPPPP